MSIFRLPVLLSLVSALSFRPCGDAVRLVVLAAVAFGLTGSASGQVVRTKKPDRGVYRPPVIENGDSTEVEKDIAPTSDDFQFENKVGPQVSGVAEIVRANSRMILDAGDPVVRASEPIQRGPADQPRGGPLFEARLDELGRYHQVDVAPTEPGSQSDESTLRRVSHDEVTLKRPGNRVIPTRQVQWTEPETVWEGDGRVYHSGESIMDSGGGCGCETCTGAIGYGGCDGAGLAGCGGCNSCCGTSCGDIRNGRICMDCDQWFGSVELLLMFRDGIRMPTLVTTGGTSDATAGEIGQATTDVLVGDANAFDRMTAGGRLTLGTWLDSSHCRSLVFRGWYGGHQSFDFGAESSELSTIVRPFLNVTDGTTPAQDNNLIAFAGRSNGSIAVNAESDVYGGDISVRQFWGGGLGATIDVLYGYQYMGLNESLSIGTNSVAIAVPNTPVGTVQSVTDSFEADNHFHGGQIGLAMRYQENCWTFDGLIKTGFGSISRTADLRGRTTTTVGADVDTSDEGFLVQSTNSGKRRDNTFGWVPELDLTLGWHRYRRFDVTAGYHVIAMTDALRVFDTVDPDLAVNSAVNPTGQQRPAALLSYDTFFVHGIHFGLQYHY